MNRYMITSHKTSFFSLHHLCCFCINLDSSITLEEKINIVGFSSDTMKKQNQERKMVSHSLCAWKHYDLFYFIILKMDFFSYNTSPPQFLLPPLHLFMPTPSPPDPHPSVPIQKRANFQTHIQKYDTITQGKRSHTREGQGDPIW